MNILATNLSSSRVAALGLILGRPSLLHTTSLVSHCVILKAIKKVLKSNLLPILHVHRESALYTPPATGKPHGRHITKCWIDAAPSAGLIAVVNETRREYQLFELKPGWQRDGRGINWAETVGFELLAAWLIARQCTGKVLVNCDSTTALGVFAGNKNSSRHLNQVGLRLQNHSKKWPFIMRAQWVKSSLNIADGPSRGKGKSGYKETKCEVEIPEDLKKYVSCKK